MRILVTGGTGFVGSNLTEELMKQGHEVIITGHDAERKPAGFKGKYLQPSFIGLDWDEIGKIDVLFHEAAINDTTLMDKKEMFRANVDSTKELFTRVIKDGCKQIVYATSTAVYGNSPAPYKEDEGIEPLNPYAESKVAVDEFAMKLAKDHPDVVIVGLRYCNVYGPGEEHKGKRASMISQLADQMRKGNPKLFKDGEQKRDWIYVKDVVRANIMASQANESCIVNCGSGHAVTFNFLVKTLNEVLGTEREIEYINNPYEGRYQNYTECDMSCAKKKICFVPEFDAASGIKDYLG
ncbi:NAD-dependent epimerase/dehydratase family protein [archaeon]|nr:NAD-dependent epimerase/dehydratase family protein [archaeon]MBL7056803.1 NAD-dependent epimerase/dehydratase family protein [Candidatus Woesearchaeota archaeon]